jgi:hypothetical protein
VLDSESPLPELWLQGPWCINANLLFMTLFFFVDFQAPYTATAIRLLENAGVIMGGKVNMDEFGMG